MQGVPARQAADALRKALANMASHRGHERLVDLGNGLRRRPIWKARSKPCAMR